MSNPNQIDLSVQIKRFPEVQNYQVNLLLIVNGKPDKFDTHICQTLVEVFEKVSAFEKAHLMQFQNAINYEHTSWRELAMQNQAKSSK